MGHDLDESFLYTCRDFYFEKTISMVYILPLNHKYFFVGAQNFFHILQPRAGEISDFLGPCLLRGPNFLFRGGGAGPFSSMKPSVTNHVNSRIVDGKIMFPITFCFYIIVMCMLTFLTLKLVSSVFYFLSNFYFSSNDRPSKTMKNVFYFI